MKNRQLNLSLGSISLALALVCSACGGAASYAANQPNSAQSDPTPAEKRAAAQELVRLGKEQVRGGDSLRGQEYFATALDSGADADEVLPELMHAATSGMRYEAAIRYFEDYGSLMSKQRRADLGMVAAVLYLGVEQPERAKSTLEAVLRVKPNNARAHFLLGQLLRDEMNDYAGSDEHFRAYLKLEPNGENALAARAGLLKEPEEGLAVEAPKQVSFDSAPKQVAP